MAKIFYRPKLKQYEFHRNAIILSPNSFPECLYCNSYPRKICFLSYHTYCSMTLGESLILTSNLSFAKSSLCAPEESAAYHIMAAAIQSYTSQSVGGGLATR